MKKNDAEISYLQGQQSRQLDELSQAKSAKLAIEEKLERLEKAKKNVNTIQGNVGTLKRTVSKEKDQDAWKGTKKDTFETNMSALDDHYKTYYNGVDRLYDAICDEITRLENEANETGGVIGWLQNSLNSIGNELEKLFHF